MLVQIELEISPSPRILHQAMEHTLRQLLAQAEDASSVEWLALHL